MTRCLSEQELQQLDSWWRAANYLAVGMIYLKENPLLREPLKPEHIKNRLLGHWGSSPGQSCIWTHANRVIREYNLNMIYLSGPGHGAPGMLGPVYLDGSYSEIYPDKSENIEGLQRFFKQFSFQQNFCFCLILSKATQQGRSPSRRRAQSLAQDGCEQ